MASKLRAFTYQFDSGIGPLPEKLIKNKLNKGNCRLAVQDYFYSVEGVYLKPEDILLPNGFNKTGKFVKYNKENERKFFDDLAQGDIIYAERLRDKKGKEIYKPKELFKDEDEWILYFHTAIYLGKLDQNIMSFLPFRTNIKIGTPVIWHSSFISGGTSLWEIDKFCYYYKPFAVKRIT